MGSSLVYINHCLLPPSHSAAALTSQGPHLSVNKDQGKPQGVTMSWQSYIDNLMALDCTEDAAIVGCEPGQESVWAAHKGGQFTGITPAEVRSLVSKERSGLFATGCTLGGRKCTVLRDNLLQDSCTMDVRTKPTEQQQDTFCICIGKSHKALVLLRGNKDAPGGKLNPKVHDMIEHLKKSGF
ncbi:profilin-1-like [Arapaima gigas]